MGGLDHAHAHPRRGGHDAVQAGRVDHVENGADAPARLADQPRCRVLVFNLGRGIGPVAELVLQPHQPHPVARAVGQDAGQQEAGQTRAGNLREDHEQVVHWGRGEPLVAGDLVAAIAGRDRRGGVGADVGAALLLGHRHARQQAVLLLRRAQAGIVIPRGQQRLESAGKLGLVPEGRHDRVGHRYRAAVPGLRLAPDVEGRRPGDVRSGAVVPPRGGVQPAGHRDPHQLVPGRVELDLVDAMAVAVMGPQSRRVLVREPPVLLGLLTPGQPPEPADFLQRPPGALPVQGGEHCLVF